MPQLDEEHSNGVAAQYGDKGVKATGWKTIATLLAAGLVGGLVYSAHTLVNRAIDVSSTNNLQVLAKLESIATKNTSEHNAHYWISLRNSISIAEQSVIAAAQLCVLSFPPDKRGVARSASDYKALAQDCGIIRPALERWEKLKHMDDGGV